MEKDIMSDPYEFLSKLCDEAIGEREDALKRISELEAEVERLKDIPKPTKGDWVKDIQATYMCLKYGCTDRRERIKYKEKYEVDVSKFVSITSKFMEDCEAAEAREQALREALKKIAESSWGIDCKLIAKAALVATESRLTEQKRDYEETRSAFSVVREEFFDDS